MKRGDEGYCQRLALFVGQDVNSQRPVFYREAILPHNFGVKWEICLLLATRSGLTLAVGLIMGYNATKPTRGEVLHPVSGQRAPCPEAFPSPCRERVASVSAASSRVNSCAPTVTYDFRVSSLIHKKLCGGNCSLVPKWTLQTRRTGLSTLRGTRKLLFILKRQSHGF